MSVARRAKAIVTRPLGHRFPFCGTRAVAQGCPQGFLITQGKQRSFSPLFMVVTPPQQASWLWPWSIRLAMGTGSPIV